jgi:DNA-binding NarL/FixJ family response regulator
MATTGNGLPRLPQEARILIVDDHELARAGMRAMLAPEPDLLVVGEARDGAEALRLCRALRPDLVLMDVRMPQLDGLAATRALKAEFPTVAVIVVTIYENPDYLLQALRAGAAGYVLKDATQQQLVTAVRQLLRQEFLLHPGLMGELLGRLAAEVPSRPVALPERLTPREATVLRLLAQGRTNREIAAELRVAVGTVKVHIEHILAKLSVSDRTQAAVRALELGLLSPATE